MHRVTVLSVNKTEKTSELQRVFYWVTLQALLPLKLQSTFQT